VVHKVEKVVFVNKLGLGRGDGQDQDPAEGGKSQ
jgi:hypothetical protein